MSIALNYLLNLEQKIVHRKKILELLSHKEMANLRRQKKIKYLFSGYYYILSGEEINQQYYEYSIQEMVFSVLNRLTVNWYVGLYSSLEQVTWQAHNKVFIINNRFTRELTIDNNKITCKKIKDSYIFGLQKKITKNKIVKYYSDPEKTALDLIYFHMDVPHELKNHINKMKLRSYAKKYPKHIQKEVMHDEY